MAQTSKASEQISKSKYPFCVRCQKLVDEMSVSPHPAHPSEVTVQFNCHGENVQQEMPAQSLQSDEGLASFTVFNAYTNGLMPREHGHTN